MSSNWSNYVRLEPRTLDFAKEEGMAAAVHDPLWFLCRQWQFGEHQGENASSPVLLQYRMKSSPIGTADGIADPRVVPAEAILESELDDWWTIGRRIRLGQLVKAKLDHEADGYKSLLFLEPPPPYQRFKGEPDGLLVWKKRNGLGLAAADFGSQVPPDQESQPAWASRELIYRQTEESAFQTPEQRLVVDRHLGGRMDWYSVRAVEAPPPLPGPSAAQPNSGEIKTTTVVPTALEYPGSPNKRWWQFEDAAIDISSYIPDDAHSSTAIMTDLVFSHADDWFLFPVQAATGHVVYLEHLWVVDSFGRSYKSDEQVVRVGDPVPKTRWPGLNAPQDWTLFQVDGLQQPGLVLWNVADLPLQSLPIERVQFGIDEQSNLLWAVERIIDHRDADCSLRSEDKNVASNPPMDTEDTTKNREYVYTPARGVAPFWQPYCLIDEGSQGRLLERRVLADLSEVPVRMMPEARAAVLTAGIQPHQISVAAIPSSGMEIERRWQLCRDALGNPVLWIQKQRKVLQSPPARTLQFDLMERTTNG
ncbi:MAG: hypothetical protein ACKPEY_06560 [Planctomycetota bacterium]